MFRPPSTAAWRAIYPNALAQALDRVDLPESIYTRLIDEVHAALPMGETYNALLDVGLTGAFTHVYPQTGKDSGAYMSSGVYGEHPYVFLNHLDDFNLASTLAHEWGHAIHSVLFNASQPFPIARYDTFVAEIAAFVNEFLLFDYLQRNAASPVGRRTTTGTDSGSSCSTRPVCLIY